MFECFDTIKKRWRAETPRFFRRVVWTGASVSGVAIAVNTALGMAGAVAPVWWNDIFPYLVGVPAGMAAVAKLAREDDRGKEDV